MPLKTWLLFGLLIVYATPAVAAPCETLMSLSLPNTKIILAQTVAAGQFTPPMYVTNWLGTATPSLLQIVACPDLRRSAPRPRPSARMLRRRRSIVVSRTSESYCL